MTTRRKTPSSHRPSSARDRRSAQAREDAPMPPDPGPPRPFEAVAAPWSGKEGTLPRAPGGPGIEPRWAHSRKEGVGTPVLGGSRSGSAVWFSLYRGGLSEVFFPRVDRACLKNLCLVVTDGRGFVSSERDDAHHAIEVPHEGVPYYRLVNTCKRGRYRIEKEVFAHSGCTVIIQTIRFRALERPPGDYRLFILAAPHLANRGSGNSAWLGEHLGVPMLFAERQGHSLALACSSPWIGGSAGYAGTSDGWADLAQNGRLTREYGRADDGNVVLTGEVDLARDGGSFTLALGFGLDPAEAAHRSLASLYDDLDHVRSEYIDGWRAWQEGVGLAGSSGNGREARDLFRISMAVIRSHEDRDTPGAIIASLSTPWGEAQGDEAKQDEAEEGGTQGYHLVWPRDLCESAGGLLAGGGKDEAARVLAFLRATQMPDGHWPQNLWVSGTAARSGIQVEETGFPILLLDLARREGAIPGSEVRRLWPMVHRAAGYIARVGPSTQQDRWENERGYTPFTIAVVVSALLIAADLADGEGEAAVAAYLRETADAWNRSIERWLYVTGTETARRVGVPGYYARIIPPELVEGADAGHVPLNSTRDRIEASPADIVSPDALALVRFGLRAPDDPRILDTVRVIDAVTRVETPRGPSWHRYNGDGYGEHPDGSPISFRTKGDRGLGRAWPLLTGERGHYELAAGRPEEAARLLRAMENFAGDGGMIPEQVWDADDIPEKGLHLGRPTGSAMPLAWAHAEYLKLRRSIQDGTIYDRPPQTVLRYLERRTETPLTIWRIDHPPRSIAPGDDLRLEMLAPATIHWCRGGEPNGRDVSTRDSGLGIHLADLPIREVTSGTRINFEIFGSEAAGKYEVWIGQ